VLHTNTLANVLNARQIKKRASLLRNSFNWTLESLKTFCRRWACARKPKLWRHFSLLRVLLYLLPALTIKKMLILGCFLLTTLMLSLHGQSLLSKTQKRKWQRDFYLYSTFLFRFIMQTLSIISSIEKFNRHGLNYRFHFKHEMRIKEKLLN